MRRHMLVAAGGAFFLAVGLSAQDAKTDPTTELAQVKYDLALTRQALIEAQGQAAVCQGQLGYLQYQKAAPDAKAAVDVAKAALDATKKPELAANASGKK